MFDPVHVEHISYVVISPDGTLQHRSVDEVELKVVIFQNLASLFGLCNAILRQGHILPPGEPIKLVVG